MNRSNHLQNSDALIEQLCRRPSSRRVTFKPFVNVRQSRTIRSAEDKSRMHYSKMELLSMVQDARSVAILSSKKLADHSRLAVGPTEQSPSYLERLGNDDSMRGLEFMHPARQAKKQLVRRAVLKYQRLIENRYASAPYHEKSAMLASASAKLSEWSRLVSIETARVDSLSVFGAQYLIPVELEPVEITSFPLFKFKMREGSTSSLAYKTRRVTADEDDQPLKKIRRMSAT